MHNESELLSRQILDRALDGVINLDQHGRVTYWNAEAERIFGYSSEYAHSRDIIEIDIARPSPSCCPGANGAVFVNWDGQGKSSTLQN